MLSTGSKHQVEEICLPVGCHIQKRTLAHQQNIHNTPTSGWCLRVRMQTNAILLKASVNRGLGNSRMIVSISLSNQRPQLPQALFWKTLLVQIWKTVSFLFCILCLVLKPQIKQNLRKGEAYQREFIHVKLIQIKDWSHQKEANEKPLLLWTQTTRIYRTARSLGYFKREVDWPWKRDPEHLRNRNGKTEKQT